jgi:hypothetical protein
MQNSRTKGNLAVYNLNVDSEKGSGSKEPTNTRKSDCDTKKLKAKHKINLLNKNQKKGESPRKNRHICDRRNH